MTSGGSSPEPELSIHDVGELLDALGLDSEEQVTAAVEGLKLPPEDHAVIDGRVRAVRALLNRWQRRGRELTALFSSARELAELRDTDALLHRLVERAHQLMGTDVTYLSEFDEDNDELHVRSTAGAVAPTFRDLRVPPGMGLASQVVRTRCPQWTPAYQANDMIPHEAGIDAAVSDEGLVSLLGVPLVAGDRVLGVLFAANRSEHEFTPEEVALLSAFADHAAVVMQTTSLLERARRSAQASEHANQVLESNVTAMERASAVHEDLTEVVLRGGSADGVADTLSKALGRSVVITDDDLVPVAQAPFEDALHISDADGSPLSAVRSAVEQSRTSARCVFFEEADPVPEVAVAVVAAERFHGAILVGHGDLELREVERRTIERASQIAALVAVQQEAVATAEDRVRGELVWDILQADADRWSELVLRARAREVRLDELGCVLVVVTPAERRQATLRLLRRLIPAGLVGERDGALVVLAPSTDPVATARRIHEAATRAIEGAVLVVVGSPERSAELLGQSYEIARRCRRLLSGLNVSRGVVDAQAYEPYMAMFGEGGQDLERFIDATIGPVLEWDRERSTELLATLTAFSDAHASPTRTARELGVHINTVSQRLERIGLLLGDDWREAEPLFRVTVATRLHALAEAVD